MVRSVPVCRELKGGSCGSESDDAAATGMQKVRQKEKKLGRLRPSSFAGCTDAELGKAGKWTAMSYQAGGVCTGNKKGLFSLLPVKEK